MWKCGTSCPPSSSPSITFSSPSSSSSSLTTTTSNQSNPWCWSPCLESSPWRSPTTVSPASVPLRRRTGRFWGGSTTVTIRWCRQQPHYPMAASAQHLQSQLGDLDVGLQSSSVPKSGLSVEVPDWQYQACVHSVKVKDQWASHRVQDSQQVFECQDS